MNRTYKKISELIDEISMGPFGSDIKVEYFVNQGVPVLNGSNIAGVKLEDSFENYVTEERAAGYKKAIAKRGDIVVTHRGTLGQIAYIPDNSKFEKYVISQSQFRVKLKTELVNPIYFAYYFHSNEGQKRLLSFKSHVGVPALAQATSNFRQLDFPWRPKSEQDSVANVLATIDRKIELNKRISAELEAIVELLYDYWFVQFDYPNTKGKPYKTSRGKMIYNAALKREIPEGWQIKEIGDIATVKAGGDKPSEFSLMATQKHHVPIFSNGISKEGLYGYTDRAVIDQPSISVSARGTIGYSVLRMRPFVPIVRLLVLIPHEKSELKFLHETIKRIGFENSGSVQQQLTIPQISSIKILYPPEECVHQYSKIVDPYIAQIELLKEQNNELKTLSDWLLPMLMNGQVAVK